MSSHQANKDKPRSAKCRHFCFSFDTHNYCPTCRESGKGDDPCVTFESPCGICATFSEEQLIKITHRKHSVKKQKRDTTKDDELHLLGDEDDPSLDLRQTLRVLQTICLPVHHVLSPYPSSHYVPPTGGWTYYFCFFRHPPSITLGFWSLQGKVFILSLPHLVWVFIGLIAYMGLLLVKIAL